MHTTPTPYNAALMNAQASTRLTSSTLPPNPVQFYCCGNLRPSPLSPNRQTHRMSPPPVRPHILQPRYILHQFSP